MPDRDYGDRGRGRGYGEEGYGRGFNRDWNEERYGGGFKRDIESEQYGRGDSRDWDDERYGRGLNRESMGSREFNRGWGSGAGSEWNRGGQTGGGTWYRGPSSGAEDFPRHGSGGSLDPSRYYGRGLGGQYGSGGSMYGGEQTRWSSEQIGGFGGEVRTRGRFTGRGPKGWRRSDERIQEEVNEALARNPDLDASDIEVRVENGEVTLTGIVEDRGEKRLAEDIAEDVFGVDDVNNDLKIRHGFLAGLTGEKADEKDVTRRVEREPSATTAHTGSKPGATRNRSEVSGR